MQQTLASPLVRFMNYFYYSMLIDLSLNYETYYYLIVLMPCSTSRKRC